MQKLLDKISHNKYKLALLLIILLAVFFRFYAITRADVLTDEASVSFRSIGYFDWLATPYQTTPLEWLSTRPWWTYISFHDHPAFGFLLQHFQFKITGVSLLAMRFWPALYGILSVYLLYLIVRKLFNKKTALLSAMLLAISSLHIWVSRLAIQESIVILFSLLAIWLFLKALENKKYFYLLGLVTGLALAIKLTAIILWPIFLFYILFFRRDIFRQKELYFSWLVCLIFTSPYIVYNIMLYKNFGHFDFQFSYLFKQNVTAWQVRPGRFEIPSKSKAFFFMFLGLKNAISPAFLYLSILSLLGGIFVFIKQKARNISHSYYFLAITIVLYIFLFVFIGSPARFLSLIIPWLAVSIALLILYLFKLNKYIAWALLFLFFVYQSFFSFNTNIAYQKVGVSGWTYSQLGYQSGSYGYNQLDKYLDKFLADKKTKVILPVVNQNINSFMNAQAAKQTGDGQNLMIIFDPRFYGEATVWSFTRRFFYQGWPILPYDTYAQALDVNGPDIFKSMGIKDFYFIVPTDNTLLESSTNQDMISRIQKFENDLMSNGQMIDKIYYQGKVVFRVYKF